MSRTNPTKQKRKAASKTFLLFGEGQNDTIFLKHLKGLYSKDNGLGITIRKGRGGAADGIVVDASKVPGATDQRIVILDNDKSQEEMDTAHKKAKRLGIRIIKNEPCLEGALLSLLREGTFQGKTSSWCKKEFERCYIDKGDRSNLRKYQELFPKDLIEKYKNKTPGIEEVILILENG